MQYLARELIKKKLGSSYVIAQTVESENYIVYTFHNPGTRTRFMPTQVGIGPLLYDKQRDAFRFLPTGESYDQYLDPGQSFLVQVADSLEGLRTQIQASGFITLSMMKKVIEQVFPEQQELITLRICGNQHFKLWSSELDLENLENFFDSVGVSYELAADKWTLVNPVVSKR